METKLLPDCVEALSFDGRAHERLRNIQSRALSGNAFKEIEKSVFENRSPPLQACSDKPFVVAPHPSVIFRMIADANHLANFTIASDSALASRRRGIVKNRRLTLNFKTIIACGMIKIDSRSNRVSVIKSPAQAVGSTDCTL